MTNLYLCTFCSPTTCYGFRSILTTIYRMLREVYLTIIKKDKDRAQYGVVLNLSISRTATSGE